VQVTFVVIDLDILSTVIRTVPLLWHVQKFQFLAKEKVTSSGKHLPRNGGAAELCSGKFIVAYCRDAEWKLPIPPPHLSVIISIFYVTDSHCN
jgi:hypothetical protein